MDWQAKWIAPLRDYGEVCCRYEKAFCVKKALRHAQLQATCIGVYEAALSGVRVGDAVLAPFFTAYKRRIQVQKYDVTSLLKEENTLAITVGRGWHRSRMPGAYQDRPPMHLPPALTAVLTLVYEDGTEETILTDETWTVEESQVRVSQIYDGEVYDATFVPKEKESVQCIDGPTDALIPQEGEMVREQDRLRAIRVIQTPKGETVLDFGQNVTGYVVTSLTAKAGDVVDLSFAEVLDRDGNFYTENYRSAKCQYRYICKEGPQIYRPHFTFWGFRYIRVNAFPTDKTDALRSHFEAVALHSDMRRTGTLTCSNPLLNQLFSNAVWGQKGNFLDVPTDCPQRDERLGWTGDAQVFCRTACLNFDVEKFFTKWLADLAAEQDENGRVPDVIPDMLLNGKCSAAWGDAAIVCPWEIYWAYGNEEILVRQFDSMCAWVDYVTSVTKDECLWTGQRHYGDWLALDAIGNSCRGLTREDFIASAFYAHSTHLVILAGKRLGRDVSRYETLYDGIVRAFRKAFPTCLTQTECVLAARFRLAEDPQKAADQLADMVKEAGTQIRTGFVGTPYLLHVLTKYGHQDLAYDLLLRTEYPSWLYPVTKGATTIWERWDGIRADGDFQTADMNSFNHYAYGAVADWVYTVAAGITPKEPGYARVRIAPHPDKRLGWLNATLDTRRGRVVSSWRKQEDAWRFDIVTPVPSQIVIGQETFDVEAGAYTYYVPLE